MQSLQFAIEGNHVAVSADVFSVSFRSLILILGKSPCKHDLLGVWFLFVFVKSVTV